MTATTPNYRLEKANKIINAYVLASVPAGLIPLPVIDIAAVSGVQLLMLKQIAKIYDYPLNETSGKAIVTALAGGSLSRIGASLIKAIPVVGTIIGEASMAVLSGASTYAMGQVFLKYVQSGNATPEGFDIAAAKKQYDTEFERGKQYVKDMEAERKKYAAQESDNSFDKIEKLAQMKEKGYITEEEYTTQKGKILERM